MLPPENCQAHPEGPTLKPRTPPHRNGRAAAQGEDPLPVHLRWVFADFVGEQGKNERTARCKKSKLSEKSDRCDL